MKETELCQGLIEQALRYKWQPYPETTGWDVLLVRNGIQIGVQAKLHANTKVLDQALPSHHLCVDNPLQHIWKTGQKQGPHFRAVLVPDTARATLDPFRNIAGLLRIWVLGPKYGHALLRAPEQLMEMCWNPVKPCWVPDVIPRVPAGASSPLQLTFWKQQALRLIARAKIRGHVTSADAKELQIHLEVFKVRNNPWLVTTGKIGRRNKLELVGNDPRRPDRQHPQEFQEYCTEQKKVLND